MEITPDELLICIKALPKNIERYPDRYFVVFVNNNTNKKTRIPSACDEPTPLTYKEFFFEKEYTNHGWFWRLKGGETRISGAR